MLNMLNDMMFMPTLVFFINFLPHLCVASSIHFKTSHKTPHVLNQGNKNVEPRYFVFTCRSAMCDLNFEILNYNKRNYITNIACIMTFPGITTVGSKQKLWMSHLNVY